MIMPLTQISLDGGPKLPLILFQTEPGTQGGDPGGGGTGTKKKPKKAKKPAPKK